MPAGHRCGRAQRACRIAARQGQAGREASADAASGRARAPDRQVGRGDQRRPPVRRAQGGQGVGDDRGPEGCAYSRGAPRRPDERGPARGSCARERRNRRRAVGNHRRPHRAGLRAVCRRRDRRLRPRRRRSPHRGAVGRLGPSGERPAHGDPCRHERAPPGRALKNPLRWADVDLGAISANCARILGHLPKGTKLFAVVKAGGYGHGTVPVAHAALEGGATGLAVATLEEAAEIRGLIGPEQILVMGGLVPAQARTAAATGCSVAVSNREVAEALGASDRPVPVHLKIDTGMGRFGSAPEDAPALARYIDESRGTRLAGTWTHFAKAESDEAMTRRQFELFIDTVSRLGVSPGMRHVCNSAGALNHPDFALDAVRCGISIYGCEWPGTKPALALRSLGTHVKSVEKGATVGYGALWRAPGPARVATVAIGYADGVHRARANRGHVLVRGHRAPLIGMVSMDAITLDVSEVPGVQVGDTATLIGRDGDQVITGEEVAEWSGTISYEVLTSIGQRVERRYSPDPSRKA